MKDRFSEQADQYRNFRPTYPPEILESILPWVPQRMRAWDCATGNGQMAIQLAEYFDQVEATDISPAQLAHAFAHPRIHYAQSPAEISPFPNHHFDLITVAQAVHWFQFDSFLEEVARVLRPGGVLALVGYGLNTVSPPIDALVREFYSQTLGPYWDPERKHIEARLQSIPFPLEEIVLGDWHSVVYWSLDDFVGYLSTWSALKRYQTATGKNPLTSLRARLAIYWQESLPVTIPFFARVGRKG